MYHLAVYGPYLLHLYINFFPKKGLVQYEVTMANRLRKSELYIVFLPLSYDFALLSLLL